MIFHSRATKTLIVTDVISAVNIIEYSIESIRIVIYVVNVFVCAPAATWPTLTPLSAIDRVSLLFQSVYDKSENNQNLQSL